MSESNVCASFMFTDPLPVTSSAWVPIKAAVPVSERLVSGSGDVSLGEMEHALTQRCAYRPLGLECNALQRDAELIDLRVPAELLRLAQRASHVDRAPNRRIAADTLHMKCAQERRNIEVGQFRVGLGIEVAMQLRLAINL